MDFSQRLQEKSMIDDFIGGNGTYNDSLDCFERAGIELKHEIDKYFARFKQ